MTEVRLYDYWRSSASYRVRIALNLAGIAYETVPVDLSAGAQRTAAHLERNPQGLVPVLEIDGLRLTQSLAILDYLEETGRVALCPDDPAERARMRAIALAVAVDIHPVCNLRVASHVAALTGNEAARADWMRHFIRPGLEAVEALIGQGAPGPYAMGADVSQADLCIVAQVYNAERWQVDISDLPLIGGVVAACAEIPRIAAAHPDRVRPD